MYKIVETWTSAKGYSFHNIYFPFSIILFIVSIIFILVPFYINDGVNSIILFSSGTLLLIGSLIIFYLAIRDIKRQNDWIYKEYSTKLDLSKEKNKDKILNLIRDMCKVNHLKIEETSFQGRFPILLIKSFIIDEKIQIDICMKISQEAILNLFKSNYKYWIVIFLGPLNKKNISFSETIKMELDKKFLQRKK